jgi:hypothetical protein
MLGTFDAVAAGVWEYVAAASDTNIATEIRVFHH